MLLCWIGKYQERTKLTDNCRGREGDKDSTTHIRAQARCGVEQLRVCHRVVRTEYGDTSSHQPGAKKRGEITLTRQTSVSESLNLNWQPAIGLPSAVGITCPNLNDTPVGKGPALRIGPAYLGQQIHFSLAHDERVSCSRIYR